MGNVWLTLAISSLCRKPAAATAVSVALLFVPVLLPVPQNGALFRILALTPVYCAQFEQLISTGIPYALASLPASTLLAIIFSAVSHRAYT